MTDDFVKRAFLVLGPESSGTRLVTRLLISGGCHGSDGHTQPWDAAGGYVGDFDPIVWRRSEPHGGTNLNLKMMLDKCGDRKLLAIVVVRDWLSITKSQIYWGHSGSVQEAENNIKSAYWRVFSELLSNRIDYRMTVYEELVLSPPSQVSFLQSIGLTPTVLVPIFDGNAKHREVNV